MTRLAALEKMLYYPTQNRIVDLIVQVVQPAPIGRRILDPCCGEGTAVKALARAWSMDAYGVELHEGRAAQAESIGVRVLQGSVHGLDTTEKTFDVLFLNPPYANGETARQELEFLRETTKYLRPGGMLIFVIPARIAPDCSTYIGHNFSNVKCYDYPEPEKSEFGQVVVFGVRSEDRSYYGRTPDLKPEIELGNETFATSSWWGREAEDMKKWAIKRIAPESQDLPLWESTSFETLMTERLTSTIQPLMPLRPGHQALLLAAGMFDGTEIDDGRTLVKGVCEKSIVETETENEIRRTQVTKSNVATLSLETGEVTFTPPEQLREWFEANAKPLGAAIQHQFRPAWHGDLTTYEPALKLLHAPGKLPGVKEGLLEVQKQVAAAVAFRWRKYKSVIISGEMGVGKTAMTSAAVALYGAAKVIVMCPTHLVAKWAREATKITGAKSMIPKTLSDVDEFFAGSARFMILSKETAKLGARWDHRVVQRTKYIRQERPRAWFHNDDTAPKPVESRMAVISCPKCGAVVRVDGKNKLTCAEARVYVDGDDEKAGAANKCHEPLWQAMPISAKGTKRWPLARYISRRFKNRYVLIVDEAHQMAKADTDQARAATWLSVAASRMIFMTGTVYGGRASSIFHLLYKVDPKFREAYKFDETSVFVAEHGLLEEVIKIDERTSVYGNRRNIGGGRTREIPGLDPAMIKWLIGYTIFVRLGDLGYTLPPLTEEVVSVEPNPEVKAAVQSLTQAIRPLLRARPDLLGAYLMASLGFPDCPEHEESIRDKDGMEHASIAAMPYAYQPKDLKVREIVLVERAAGRKSLVFFSQTGKRDATERVKAMLEGAGLRVGVLRADVPPEDREEWIFKLEPKIDVLLTNGRLVETGLDLLFAKTIIQYGVEYSIPTLRQSTRRSWRLGQTEPVRIVYLAYAGTMQETAMKLIAAKARAAELIDGDGIGGLSSTVGGDLFVEIMRQALEDE